MLAQVAEAFAEHGVSIETVRQQRARATTPPLVVVTHAAPDAALSATVESLAELDVVRVGRQRDAGRGASRTGVRPRPWRGVIEEYRDRLPFTADVAVVTPRRGRHAAGPGAAPVRAAPAARSG